MKTISIYILAIIFLSAAALGTLCKFQLPQGVSEMQIYSCQTPSVGEGDGVDIMTNFNIFHYYGSVVSIKDKKLDNTLGVAYIYPKDKMSAQKAIKEFSAEIAFEQELADGVTYYGYTKEGRKSVKLDGKEINIQIVSNKDNIIVGFPLIMGSY